MIYPIGSISLFINVNQEQNSYLDNRQLDLIASEIEKDFKEQIRNQEFDVDFNLEIVWRRGCIIETISLGVILLGTYKFVIDYDKIRKNLKLIVNDLKGAYLKITGNRNNKKLDISNIKVIRNLDEKIDTLSSKSFAIKTKKEIVLIHKIAVMRYDLIENISYEDLLNFIDKNKK